MAGRSWTAREPAAAVVPAAGAIAGLGVAALIIASAGALWPHSVTPDFLPHQDKLEHVVAFGAISGLLSLLVDRRWRLCVVTGLVAYAGVIEILQGVMQAGRQADMADFWAGAFGAVAAGLIATALRAAFGPQRVAVVPRLPRPVALPIGVASAR